MQQPASSFLIGGQAKARDSVEHELPRATAGRPDLTYPGIGLVAIGRDTYAAARNGSSLWGARPRWGTSAISLSARTLSPVSLDNQSRANVQLVSPRQPRVPVSSRESEHRASQAPAAQDRRNARMIARRRLLRARECDRRPRALSGPIRTIASSPKQLQRAGRTESKSDRDETRGLTLKQRRRLCSEGRVSEMARWWLLS